MSQVKQYLSGTPNDPRPEGFDGNVSVNDWCSHFGTIPALTPFQNRVYDPIAYLLDVREAIDNARETKATFTSQELSADIGHPEVDNEHRAALLRIAGCWEYCETSEFPDDQPTQRWVNPNYIHLKNGTPSITDSDERDIEIERAAAIGLPQTALAPRFGYDESYIADWFYETGRSYRERKAKGRKRLLRTVEVIREWTHWSAIRIADALGVNSRTLHGRLKRNIDFDVPPDPSYTPWFGTVPKADEIAVPSGLSGSPLQIDVFEVLQRLQYRDDGYYLRNVSPHVERAEQSAVQDSLQKLAETVYVDREKGAHKARYRVADAYQQEVSGDFAIEPEIYDLFDRAVGSNQREIIEQFLELETETIRSDEIRQYFGAENANNYRNAMRRLRDRGIVEAEPSERHPQMYHYRLADRFEEFKRGGR